MLAVVLWALLAAHGGLAVSVLAIEPKFLRSNLAEEKRFLRAIKIRSVTPFGGEVKASVSCHINPASLLDHPAGRIAK
jgi:hypothetical protein